MTDDVPDLEDCSDLVKQCFKKKQLPECESGNIEITTVDSGKVPLVAHNSVIPPSSAPEIVKEVVSEETRIEKPKLQFGGMRKGFLLGPKPKSTDIEKHQPKVENMPYITKSAEKEKNSLVMKEVQQQLIDKKSEWLTEDLLKNIQNSDDEFLSMLSNPEFGSVLTEFQQNPQQAMVKYQNNKKITGFFLKFAQIMGEHFTKIGAKNV